MNRIKVFISNNRSYFFTVLLYNYFWFIVPIQSIMINLNESLFKEGFVALTAIPGMFFMVYHYFFKYYFAVVFSIYLVYTIIFKEKKKLQHVISLILTLLYILLFFYAVRFDVSEFPFPRVT